MGCPSCGENKVINAKFCYNCGVKFNVPAFKDVTLYLHSDKDELIELGNDLNLSTESLRNFMRALHEVEFNGKVNMSTGDFIVETIMIDSKLFLEDGSPERI